MNFKDRFDRLKSKKYFSDDSELLSFFDTLPSVDVNEILSPWSGGDFNTGHWANEKLKEMNWFGKHYKSLFEAIPLICYSKEKDKLYSRLDMKGEATLWNVEFRGKVSATMIYDGVPIFDHLRKVDDNTLMGVMNGKKIEGIPDIIQNGHFYYFFLERLSSFPLAII